MEYNNNFLPLNDIYEVSWLHYNGIEANEVKQGGRVVFEVPAIEETYRLLREYQEGPTVPLLDFVRALRRVRARMLDVRDGNGKRNWSTAYGNKE